MRQDAEMSLKASSYQGAHQGTLPRTQIIQLLDAYNIQMHLETSFEAAVAQVISRTTRSYKLSSRRLFPQTLHRCHMVPGFVTPHADDVIYGSLGKAHSYKWPSILTPEVRTEEITKAAVMRRSLH